VQEYKSRDYVIQVHDSWQGIAEGAWNALLAQQQTPTLFMQHAYLQAIEVSQAASPDTGWALQIVTLWQSQEAQEDATLGPPGLRLCAAAPLYAKDHSYGEYVFDWAWADAYQRNGLRYYPKALVAVPFTPVPGSRLLAVDAQARQALAQTMIDFSQSQGLSSLHLLFGDEADLLACSQAGMMLRRTVQFHWQNSKSARSTLHEKFTDFDDFLSHLSQEKRKKIRQERRKVAQAGVLFRVLRGAEITSSDWDFFYQCYERTYLEHGNKPYLSRDFFAHMQQDMAEHWLLFVGEIEGRPVACSLLGLDSTSPEGGVAYGRYWGALERVDCLHFEACYYQPIVWCIANGFIRFEGGAQGEHKMARALLPVTTSSAHWLSHPGFADAVARFLAQEGQGVEAYMDDLNQRSPLKEG
jgi:predicted N-acyltransferase